MALKSRKPQRRKGQCYHSEQVGSNGLTRYKLCEKQATVAVLLQGHKFGYCDEHFAGYKPELDKIDVTRLPAQPILTPAGRRLLERDKK